MGYYASGTGSVIFKKGVDVEEVESTLIALDTFINWDIKKDGVYFCDRYCDEEEYLAFYEGDTSIFLDALVPYIVEGEAVYSGEDDCNWRFRFDPDEQKWVEESATIDYNFESYTDEQMIEELDKRGYIVQKKPQSD